MSIQQLARSYQVELSWQFGQLPVPMVIAANGDVCIDVHETSLFQPAVPCGMRGRITVTDSAAGFVDFELTRFDSTNAYRGRGWMESRGAQRALVLVGEAGSLGLGLVGK